MRKPVRELRLYIYVAVITYRLIAIIEIDLKVWGLYLSRAYPWQSCAYHRLCCTAKQKAYAAVNSELIELYWQIGAYISQQVEKAAWGKSVVEQLADYIRAQEPNSERFSKQNLWRMKLFYETYKIAGEILSTLSREISWSHNTLIMSRCKTVEEREFYIRMSIKEHYSVRELERQIDSSLFERYATNQIKLSPVVREIAPKAESIFRDHYVKEFVGEKVGKPENTLRKALVSKMKDFILELGKDFIHMGDEYRLQVGNL